MLSDLWRKRRNGVIKNNHKACNRIDAKEEIRKQVLRNKAGEYGVISEKNQEQKEFENT